MKILLIEDEAGISAFLKQGLEEEGYEIAIATNGADGLQLAKSQSYNLILLDWMLPKMKGIDVCHAIRATDKETPILFLTAKDTLQETIEGLKAGANDYIKKPFSFEELLERIKIHFRKMEHEDILVLGNVRIFPTKRRVFSGKREVLLTHREYELLSYLFENKGKVCTRQQIINDVWNIHFDYDTGVIDVFINALRKKIGLNKDEMIKTIRGVGYIAE